MKIKYFLALCGVVALAYGVKSGPLPSEDEAAKLPQDAKTAADKGVLNQDGSTPIASSDNVTTTAAAPTVEPTTSEKPEPNPNTTTVAPNTTTTAPDTTTPPSTTPTTSTTLAPTPGPSPNTTTSTTVSPPPTPTPSPNTTTVAPSTTTEAPKPPVPCKRFDAPSFIGGIVLTLGLLVIAFIAYKFYRARNELHYQTL